MTLYLIARYKCGNCGIFDIKIREQDEKKTPFKLPCPKCKSNSGLTKVSSIGNKRCG